MHHVVRVVDPGHRLRVRVHVRRGDVGMRTDHVAQLGDEAAGDLAQLVPRVLLRIADDAALRPTERDVGHGALPGHPRGESAHLVGVHVGVVADAALAGAAHARVQRAEADERPHHAVIPFDRELDRRQPRRAAEIVSEPFRQIGHILRSRVELLLGDAVGIEVFG